MKNLTKKCTICGGRFVKKHAYSEAYWKKRKFCTNVCYGKWRAKNIVGENHPTFRNNPKGKKYCPHCKRTLAIKHFFKNKGRRDGLSVLCRTDHMVISNAVSRELRNRVLEYLGGKCRKCGFSDRRALQIDHVHSDGKTERTGEKGLSPSRFYERVLATKPNTRYQLLCANCNWIKRVERKEHFHSALAV